MSCGVKTIGMSKMHRQGLLKNVLMNGTYVFYSGYKFLELDQINETFST